MAKVKKSKKKVQWDVGDYYFEKNENNCLEMVIEHDPYIILSKDLVVEIGDDRCFDRLIRLNDAEFDLWDELDGDEFEAMMNYYDEDIDYAVNKICEKYVEAFRDELGTDDKDKDIIVYGDDDWYSANKYTYKLLAQPFHNYNIARIRI